MTPTENKNEPKYIQSHTYTPKHTVKNATRKIECQSDDVGEHNQPRNRLIVFVFGHVVQCVLVPVIPATDHPRRRRVFVGLLDFCGGSNGYNHNLFLSYI